MKDMWLAMCHYSNQPLAVVSFSLKHTFRRRSVDCPGGSLDFFFSSLPIHYHFTQTVISTGNLHPAAICVCGECKKKKERERERDTCLRCRGICFSTAAEHQSENLSLWSWRICGFGKGIMSWKAPGTNITLLPVACMHDHWHLGTQSELK